MLRLSKGNILSFEQFNEAKQLKLFGTLNIFDIDETLMHTTAKIAVLKNGQKIKELDNREFNSYKLKPGETFDFSQFRDAKKFYDESKPIQRMFDKVHQIMKNKNAVTTKVILLTARADFDSKEIFLQAFRKHGFPIDDVYVERAGNMAGDEIPATKKAQIVAKYAKTNLYDKMRMFDDSMSNLKAFLKLRSDFPHIDFEAYFANTDGTIKTIK